MKKILLSLLIALFATPAFADYLCVVSLMGDPLPHYPQNPRPKVLGTLSFVEPHGSLKIDSLGTLYKEDALSRLIVEKRASGWNNEEFAEISLSRLDRLPDGPSEREPLLTLTLRGASTQTAKVGIYDFIVSCTPVKNGFQF